MIFKGVQLNEESRTLLDYDVAREAIHLVLRLRGDAGPANFVDVSNSSTLKVLELSDTAPAWRRCEAALTRRQMCQRSLPGIPKDGQ